MITVKLFGTLRVDSGISEFNIDNVERVKDLYNIVYERIIKSRPNTTITKKFLKSCIISVNGEWATIKTSLKENDVIGFYTPCGGG